MIKTLRTLDERSVALLVLASSLVIGLGFPPIASMLAPVALTGLFFVVIFSLAPFASIPLKELISLNGSVGRVLVWQQLVLPAIVVALGILCKLQPYVIALLVVTACSGALFAAPALASLLHLDRREALQCMVLTTLFMPVSLFVYLTVAHGGQVTLDLRSYSIRVLVFLVLPFLMFVAYRPLAQRLSEEQTEFVEWSSRWAVVIALSVFGIGMMARVTNQLLHNPAQVFFFLGLTTFVCMFMLLVTTIVMYRHGLNSALTAAILSGFRNVGLGYALIGEMIGPELAVYTGVGLLPVFIAPAILKFFAAQRISSAAAAS